MSAAEAEGPWEQRGAEAQEVHTLDPPLLAVSWTHWPEACWAFGSAVFPPKISLICRPCPGCCLTKICFPTWGPLEVLADPCAGWEAGEALCWVQQGGLQREPLWDPSQEVWDPQQTEKPKPCQLLFWPLGLAQGIPYHDLP